MAETTQDIEVEESDSHGYQVVQGPGLGEVEYEYADAEEGGYEENVDRVDDGARNPAGAQETREQGQEQELETAEEPEAEIKEETNQEPATAASVEAVAEEHRPEQEHEQEQEQDLQQELDLQQEEADQREEPAEQHKGVTGAEMDLKQIETQAAKVAKDVQNAAVEMSHKLSAGLMSALGGLGTAAAESQSLNKITGGLASWWNSLDPPSAPKRNETEERVQASSKATSELQELFGLEAEENLVMMVESVVEKVETFKCKLLQTYAASHNSFTPAIQMAFQGTLYITDRHTCFTVEERNRKLPFKVLHTDITKAVRHRPTRKGDLSDILRLELDEGESSQVQQFLAFKDFDSGGALDSALALVEHLMEGH